LRRSARRTPTCSSPASTAPEKKSWQAAACGSRRARAWPLVAVNAGGLPEGTFESEIFGHVKGAFTDARTDRIGRFELANGGTLFLDEIANVPLRQQAKLLRVLETGELERVGSSQTRRVDVRILSATNALLHDEAEGRQLPRRPSLPHQHGGDSPARAARPARRYSAAGRALS
jgi:transcriptional regulator of aromatic amino acid metabolism